MLLAVDVAISFDCSFSKAFQDNYLEEDPKGEFALKDSIILGEGGNGIVYSFIWKEEDGEAAATEVVAKVNKSKYGSDISLINEVEVMATLKAEGLVHVPKFYGCFRDQSNKIYVIMEKMIGDLFPVDCFERETDWFKSFEDKTAVERLEVYAKIAEAIQEFHGKGYTHGDIKPENLAWALGENKEWVLKLIDFGSTAKNPTKNLGGTMKFWDYEAMFDYSKKIYKGADYIYKDSWKQDIWALGVTIYALENPNSHSIEDFLEKNEDENPKIKAEFIRNLVIDNKWIMDQKLNLKTSQTGILFRDVLHWMMQPRRTKIKMPFGGDNMTVTAGILANIFYKIIRDNSVVGRVQPIIHARKAIAQVKPDKKFGGCIGCFGIRRNSSESRRLIII